MRGGIVENMHASPSLGIDSALFGHDKAIDRGSDTFE
jgi:hypothetical protein